MTEVVDVRMFASQKHPRAPKGSQAGGEFAPAKQSSKGSAGKSTGATHAAAHHSDVLSYDGNTGTGYGSKNGDPRVHKLQEALNGLGITDAHGEQLVDDGKLGPKTTEAVKAAQKRLGLPQDGKVTPALLHKLTEAKTSTKTKTKTPHRSNPAFLLDARADASKPYGDVSYADPGYQPDGKKRYPLDSEAHCRAAWSYINQADNAGRYTAEQLAAIKSRIKAAGKKYGIEFSDSGRSRPAADLCVRSFDFEFEQRAGDGRTLEGYAAVFDAPTKIRDVGGDFEETILPGAFGRSIRARTPILQWDHGKDPRIGTAPIGAIENLAEDSKGLHVRARLFDHPDIERVRLAIQARAVKGMSFRFGVPEGGDEWPTRDRRNIRDADVHELGPVAFPAYDTTSVTVRTLLAQLDPDEHRALVRELAADVRAHLDADDAMTWDDAERLAVDLDEDLTGGSDARSADRGEPDTEPGNGAASPMHLRQRLDEGALRARGIK